MPAKAVDATMRAEIVRLYRLGHNTREVGKRVGISHPTVGYALMEAREPTRRSGTPRRPDAYKVILARSQGFTLREAGALVGVTAPAAVSILRGRGLVGDLTGLLNDYTAAQLRLYRIAIDIDGLKHADAVDCALHD